jgi:hypothetical protein
MTLLRDLREHAAACLDDEKIRDGDAEQRNATKEQEHGVYWVGAHAPSRFPLAADNSVIDRGGTARRDAAISRSR